MNIGDSVPTPLLQIEPQDRKRISFRKYFLHLVLIDAYDLTTLAVLRMGQDVCLWINLPRPAHLHFTRTMVVVFIWMLLHVAQEVPGA
jgi:hypothetical protein